jgi:integrase
MGSLYRRGTIWWIKYYRNGSAMPESSESSLQSKARRLLAIREGDIARGLPITPRQSRITIAELLEDVKNDYRANHKRTIRDIEIRCRLDLIPSFGSHRAANLTTDQIRNYIRKRQEEKGANATINRELAALKRGFTLAAQAGKLLWKPYIPMLQENNVRHGFFEPSQLKLILDHLARHVRPVVRFAHITGWRCISEVLPLKWSQVDFQSETVRLEPGTTKNKQARVFPMTLDLKQVLSRQWDKHQELAPKGIDCTWVFPYRGRRFKGFRRAWRSACRKAGITGRIPHDFRRTAVRNLTRAGVVERVAMQMTGHLTREVFERYNIVSQTDVANAKAALDSKELGTVSGTEAANAPEVTPDVGESESFTR